MSQYPTIEAALLTHLRTLADPALTTANTSRGNYRVLDARGTRISVVLSQHAPSRFGFALRDRAAQGRRQEEHFIRCSVYVARQQGDTGDDVAYILCQEAAAKIYAHVMAYPRLNATPNLKRVVIDEISSVDLIGPQDKQATHYTCDLIVTAFCEVAYSTNEAGQ